MLVSCLLRHFWDVQVTHVLVEGPDGKPQKIPASLVIVGVGARPNTGGQLGQQYT